MLRKGLNKLSYSIKKYNPYLNRYSKSMTNEMVDEAVEKAFQVSRILCCLDIKLNINTPKHKFW
jgi:hypothetical protein